MVSSMTMSMVRAFGKMMLTELSKVTVEPGYYDDKNDYIRGSSVESPIYGVLLAGNRFSQFDEGIALKPTEGGDRFSDYRSLYVQKKYMLNVGDKVGYLGSYFNVLQMSDESHFGFRSYILEASNGWTP